MTERKKFLAVHRWHQGFGVIRVGGLEAVPFQREETAIRIAARAELVIRRNQQIQVFHTLDGWCYAVLPKERK